MYLFGFFNSEEALIDNSVVIETWEVVSTGSEISSSGSVIVEDSGLVITTSAPVVNNIYWPSDSIENQNLQIVEKIHNMQWAILVTSWVWTNLTLFAVILSSIIALSIKKLKLI